MDKQLEEFKQLLNESLAKGAGGPIDLLLGQMDPDRARCLRLCAIPHEFNMSILRALAPNLGEAPAAEYYDEFSKLSLIEKRGESLAIHAEPRKYLFEQWLAPQNEKEFALASKRLVDFFAASPTETEKSEAEERTVRNRMFHLIGATRGEGLAEFERLCRQRREELRYGQCETLIKLVHEYDRILNPLENAIVAYHEGKLAADRGQWSAAEELYGRVLATNQISIDLRTKTLCRLGMVYDSQRQWNSAIAFFKKGLDLADGRPECARQFVHLHLNLGSTYRDSNNLPDAKRFLERGIALAKQIRDLSSVADGYNSLGALYLKSNDTPNAIEAFETSLKFLDEAGEKFRRAQVFNNLGNAYANAREWQKSEQFFEQSLEIKRQAGDNSGQAMTLNNLVRVHRAQQQNNDAIKASEDAVRLFEEVRDFYNAAVAKRNLARIYRAMENVDLAGKAYEEAAALFARAHDLDQAESTRKEGSQRKRGIPWWAIAAVVLFLLLIVAVIILLARS